MVDPLKAATRDHYLVCGPRAVQVENLYWRHCEQQRIPYVVCRRGPVRCWITVDTDPTYRCGHGQRFLTKPQVDFIFGLFDKYVPLTWRKSEACGGGTVIEIIGFPTDRAIECLREIVDCLRENFAHAS